MYKAHFSQAGIGEIEITSSEKELLSVRFLKEVSNPVHTFHPLLEETRKQLKAYFSGHLLTFDLPLRLGGTDFQNQVWRELLHIPFGKTTSYGEIARKLGDPNCVRAVGAANGKNPIAIIVPCHRVIGSTGNLTGYAGGLERKQWLLNFEARQTNGQIEMF